MAKLIQKSGFIKPGKAGGYIGYIATRDGVEKLPGPEGYVEYMAMRPGTERYDGHGLFSSQPVDLNAVMKEAEQHDGPVWTLIYSLRREDAARLGYDNAKAWQTLLKAHQVELATAMKIPPEQFQWYAAYHDEGEHPHIHMTVWANDPKQGFLTPTGIKAMRSVLTNSIFQDELYSLYQRKDVSYKELTAQARASLRELVQQMENTICDSPVIEMQMVHLADKLKALQETCSGQPTEKLQPDMTFGEWLDFWYQNYSKPKLRPKSQLDYENSIYRHIIPALGNIPLSKLAANDLQQFYAQVKKGGRLIRTQIYGEGLSDRMVRACHTRCLTALDRAVVDGLIRINHAADCKLPEQALKDMNLLTREEMQRFLIQAKEEGYFELFLLELATGLRRGEVLALQWDDLDFETGALHIQRQVYRANGELVVSAPKTKAALRTIVLPPALVGVLEEHRQHTNSRWMFPSLAKEDSPLDPATVRKRLQTILEHAGCRKVRFHDLRHLFVTTALENGMDVKTLSTIIGHVSAKTTLNVYTHVTDTMRQTAAAKIDQGIGRCEPQDKVNSGNEGLPTQPPGTRSVATFEPYKGKIRKPGTGCVTQINDHLWEGKFSPKWPDGKKHSRSIYAGTESECEEKLADLIRQMKAEIAESKRLVSEGRWDEAMALAGQKKARGMRKVVLKSRKKVPRSNQ